MHCTRCQGTGFLNLEQVDEDILIKFGETGDHCLILDWIDQKGEMQARLGGCACHINPPCCWCLEQHDVQVCDCCGDGTEWYNEPGEHLNHRKPGDPIPDCI